MKTLYISDLDGTLLQNDATLSPYTLDTLSYLDKKGVCFSYATARSLATASVVTKGYTPKAPVIIYNGTFIIDAATKKRLLSRAFSDTDVAEMVEIFRKKDFFPTVYAFFGDREKYSFVKERLTPEALDFVSTHTWDERQNPIIDESALFNGEVFHITCIAKENILIELQSELEKHAQCVRYIDTYSGNWWLELHPKGATKASAILELKKMLGCDRVVCFGDGKNDISMFEACDEAYAVSNADSDLKKIATAIIDSNESDGVAKYLRRIL